MEQPLIRRQRLIGLWTSYHTVIRKLPTNCEHCDQEILFGEYKREVWIDSHPRFGDFFVIRRYHLHCS